MSRSTRFAFAGALCALLGLTGCRQPLLKSTPPPPSQQAHPRLQKTFGEVSYGGAGTLLIRYKDIVLLVDPLIEPPEASLGPYSYKLKGMSGENLKRSQASSLYWDNLPSVDYLLLTDALPHHFGPSAKQYLRKSIKILCPPESEKIVQQAGFNSAKSMTTGQRILLQKKDGFLFVSAVQSRNSVSGVLTNGYLLEFDNGRNLFIGGEIVDMAPLREFLYGLRDDGKTIHLAFLYGGGLRSAAGDALESLDENEAAEVISLLQPEITALVQTDSFNLCHMEMEALRRAMQSQISSGSYYIPKDGDIIPF